MHERLGTQWTGDQRRSATRPVADTDQYLTGETRDGNKGNHETRIEIEGRIVGITYSTTEFEIIRERPLLWKGGRSFSTYMPI